MKKTHDPFQPNKQSASAAISLADYPWFWVGLFSLAALIALAIIGPKYIRRQQRLDRQQQTREQVYRDRVDGQPADVPVDEVEGAAAGDDQLAQMRFWTLMFVATAVVIVSWSVLWRQMRVRRTQIRAGAA